MKKIHQYVAVFSTVAIAITGLEMGMDHKLVGLLIFMGLVGVIFNKEILNSFIEVAAFTLLILEVSHYNINVFGEIFGMTIAVVIVLIIFSAVLKFLLRRRV